MMNSYARGTAGVLLLLSSLQAQAANCTAAPVDGALYTIANLSNGLVLDVVNGATTAGAPIQQWGYAGSNNQQFYVRDAGNGYWTIRPKPGTLRLDVQGSSKFEGAAVLQNTASSATSQLWQLKKSTTGAYNVVSVNSGKSLTAASTSSGARLSQATDTASGLQRWFFNPVSGTCGGAVVTGFAAQSGSDGLATTTGGGSAAPVTVTSCSAMTAALQSTSPAVVQIPANTTIDCRTPARTQVACAVACPSYQDPGKISYRIPVAGQTCTSLGSSTDATYARSRNEVRIFVGSNKTLVGLDANSRVLGATLELNSVKNVIIRNLTIADINPGLVEGGDGIGVNSSSHVWIDHVKFSLISDGHVDISKSKNVTLSWNRFDGVNPAVCGGKHHYTNAVADSQVTLHHNFWDKASGRNPKLDGAATRAHLYNNYWLDIPYFAINASASAQAKVEGNFFANAAKPHWNNGGGLISANIASNRYTGISATDAYKDTGATVFGDITLYSYTLDNVDALPAALIAGTGPR